jgi:hypothetical protein
VHHANHAAIAFARQRHGAPFDAIDDAAPDRVHRIARLATCAARDQTPTIGQVESQAIDEQHAQVDPADSRAAGAAVVRNLDRADLARREERRDRLLVSRQRGSR